VPSPRAHGYVELFTPMEAIDSSTERIASKPPIASAR
jgi:hypothetical protein